MRYEYQYMPNFYIDEKGFFNLISFTRLLIPFPENEEESLALEE